MTADAKVGLLLGLFFIVIIAFLVNGLPNFIKASEPDEIQTVTIRPPTASDLPLDDNVDRVVEQLRPIPLRPRISEPPQEVVVLDALQPGIEVPAPAPVTERLTPVTVIEPPAPIKPAAPAAAKPNPVHTVQSGESLAVIAKKYYGSEQGNRHLVIQKLYEANAGVLKSADRVCVGDRLTIPPLDTLLNPSGPAVQTPRTSDTLLTKFSNLLERVGPSTSRSVSEYTVQEGDSLWSIAEDALGEGKRYSEIARVNKIRNSDELKAGMRIKIPAQ